MFDFDAYKIDANKFAREPISLWSIQIGDELESLADLADASGSGSWLFITGVKYAVITVHPLGVSVGVLDSTGHSHNIDAAALPYFKIIPRRACADARLFA